MSKKYTDKVTESMVPLIENLMEVGNIASSNALRSALMQHLDFTNNQEDKLLVRNLFAGNKVKGKKKANNMAYTPRGFEPPKKGCASCPDEIVVKKK